MSWNIGAGEIIVLLVLVVFLVFFYFLFRKLLRRK